MRRVREEKGTMATNSFPNHYEILRIATDAERSEIVEAFWTKTRELRAEKRSAAATAARFNALFIAFRILISARRRRAYDALRGLRDDFDRTKAPEWKRYRDWVKALTAEAESLGALELGAIRRHIAMTDSLFFLRIILIGDESLSARAWASLIVKMTALAGFVVGLGALPYARIVAAAGWRLEELKLISDFGRALIGIGAGVGSFALFVGLLLAPAIVSANANSLVGRIGGGLVRLFLADQGALFPALPAVLVFGLSHLFWSHLLGRLLLIP